jgi:hypothetical protein
LTTERAGPASNVFNSTAPTILDDAGKTASGVAQLSSQRTPAWPSGSRPQNDPEHSLDLGLLGKVAFRATYSGFNVYECPTPLTRA